MNEEIDGYAAGIWQFAESGGDVLGNAIVDSDTGIHATTGPDHRVASNRVEGGDLGIRVGGAGLVGENEVTGAGKQGFRIPVDATVTLTGSIACDNGQDRVIARNTTPTIDDTNTFCDQT